MSETIESSMPKKVESKERDKLLTVWLVLMLIANVGTALIYLLWNSAISAGFTNTPAWVFYIFGILGFANVVFTVFLFKWKKWAFFAYCVSSIVAFVLNLIVGIGMFTALLGLVGPIVFYSILRSRWDLFE